MIVRRIALPRRTFLRGMGATLALPFLDAMVPAVSGQGKTSISPARRLSFVYVGMGSDKHATNWTDRWTPREVGRISQLSPSLAALEPLIDQVTVLTNLESRNAGVAAGFHATANSCFLSCAQAKRTEGSDIYSGTTIDQIAARHIGKDTPVPSLELGTDLIAQVGDCDSGFACAYMNNLSWSSPTTPLPAEADPRVVFERLFGDGGTPQARRAELRKNGSILDLLTEDMARVQRQLGAADRKDLEQYIDSVREVERRIEIIERQSSESPLPDLERPTTVSASWDEHVKLLLDLQVLAFRADATRVMTFQLVREGSTRTYPQIGVPDAHHPVSHHSNDPESLAKVAALNAYHVSLWSYYLTKLHATPDGDGSLLDHSICVFGSGMGNPNVHDHKDLPIILAGGGAGRLKGGRHIKLPELTPLANLWLTLMEKLDLPLESFGDSTGKLEGV
jgi:hypothetical protein